MPKRPLKADQCLVVLVTCPSKSVALRISREILNQRLAACVNICPGVTSSFWWQGKIDQCKESLLIVKTTRRRFKQLCTQINSLHPYDVPEVIAMSIVMGNNAYLDWVKNSVHARNV